jgi:hypothetical protein
MRLFTSTDLRNTPGMFTIDDDISLTGTFLMTPPTQPRSINANQPLDQPVFRLVASRSFSGPTSGPTTGPTSLPTVGLSSPADRPADQPLTTTSLPTKKFEFVSGPTSGPATGRFSQYSADSLKVRTVTRVERISCIDYIGDDFDVEVSLTFIRKRRRE